MVWPPGEVDMCDSAKGPAAASYKRELKDGGFFFVVFLEPHSSPAPIFPASF